MSPNTNALSTRSELSWQYTYIRFWCCCLADDTLCHGPLPCLVCAARAHTPRKFIRHWIKQNAKTYHKYFTFRLFQSTRDTDQRREPEAFIWRVEKLLNLLKEVEIFHAGLVRYARIARIDTSAMDLASRRFVPSATPWPMQHSLLFGQRTLLAQPPSQWHFHKCKILNERSHNFFFINKSRPVARHGMRDTCIIARRRGSRECGS